MGKYFYFIGMFNFTFVNVYFCITESEKRTLDEEEADNEDSSPTKKTKTTETDENKESTEEKSEESNDS
jgi:hypothetical protein